MNDQHKSAPRPAIEALIHKLIDDLNLALVESRGPGRHQIFMQLNKIKSPLIRALAKAQDLQAACKPKPE